MEKRIIKIEATQGFRISNAEQRPLTRRVVGYARVSTEKDEQQSSLEAQMTYFPTFISEHPGWEYLCMYYDEGISATGGKQRPQFQKMMEDGLARRFDLIVTKSVSRFARNTVDSLNSIRALKAAGVEVFFQKENIFTFDSKGEFLITLMSSLAQEESRSLSENTAWGQRKRMARGEYSMPYTRFLGYKKGGDGKPEIVEEEAVIVRRIYRMFLEGHTTSGIGIALTNEGVPTPGGKRVWQKNVVYSILTNEKYAGNALLQKGFTTDYLTKTRKKNEGELEQFWIEDGHEGIVSKAVFDEVKRRIEGKQIDLAPTVGIFSNKIFCGECGGLYGHRFLANYREGDPRRDFRKAHWRCGNVYGGSKDCTSQLLHEEPVAYIFNQAVLELFNLHPEVLRLCENLCGQVVKDENRQAKIGAFIANAAERSPCDFPLVETAWRVMVERAEVFGEVKRMMRIRFITGETLKFPIRDFMPNRMNFVKDTVLARSLQEIQSSSSGSSSSES